MPTYKTPSVYVEEKSTLPPSVAEVATAIPAFIGYTAKGKGGDAENKAEVVEVAQVSSLREYEQRFGAAGPTKFNATCVAPAQEAAQAAGDAKAQPATPTDATIDPIDPVPKNMLWYAIDLYFRNGGGRCYVLSIGNEASAATQAAFKNGLDALTLLDEPTLIVMPQLVTLEIADFNAVNQQALMQCHALGDRFAILDVKASAKAADDNFKEFREGVGNDNLMYGAAYYPYLDTVLTHVYDEKQVTIGGDAAKTLDSIKGTETELYNKIKKLLADQRVRLPPSAAIAGIYARVDRDRGVWKAPANVSLMSTVGPAIQISHDQQEGMNVDPTSGKSINAIRSFAGKGTLVWGARTLAGNDNEWRYVPVRRLFITIEESTKKATAFAVFEPNDATTWLKVRGMIESYLYGLWQQGALQGADAKSAYFVNVGLGTTMTAQDILEGRMIVEIGVAAVRPAEFIILRFSHKLATS